MEITMMGSSNLKVLKGDEVIKELGFCNNMKNVELVGKSRICLVESNSLRKNENDGWKIKAVHTGGGVTPVERKLCGGTLTTSSSNSTFVRDITVGLGPDGELRYPSSDYTAKTSNHSGVGEFQCYDKYMLSNLKQHAEATGNPLWGLGGPHDVPTYDEPPSVTSFFKDEGGSWEMPYGDFSLSWYSSQLISHGNRILSLASTVFCGTPIALSGKLPLLHSWYRTRSHPSELTAGFYNTANGDGYEPVAEMFAENSCSMILPGMDLSNKHQPLESSPQALLAQIKGSCRRYGVLVSGQNLSISGGSEGFEEIHRNLSDDSDVLKSFMYQRMGADFFSPKHFPLFIAFVRTLSQPDMDIDDMPDAKEVVEPVHVSSEAGLCLHAQAV